MSSVGSERHQRDRILPRHQFEARVKIVAARHGKKLCTEGWVRDLSESGLGAFVGAELSIGEGVALTIPLTNQIELAVPAVVTRTVGTEYGFQFTALSGKQREQLRKVLAACKAVPESL